MDILYKLPFPQEVCSKIFMYTCKSPHTGLGVAILKKIIGLPIYNKLIAYGGVDADGNVVKITNIILTSSQENQLTFDIDHLKSLQNLTEINLGGTGVSGDIAHLKSLPNLTKINLGGTGVTGNIEHLKSLPNLTEIYLYNTSVNGNIEHLKSLPNLTEIYLYNTGVTGNIEHLKLLPNLIGIYLISTGVTGTVWW